MTTTLAHQTTPTPTAGVTAPVYRLTLAGAIRSEWIKAASLRSIRWSIAVSILLGLGMSLVMGFALRSLIPEASQAGGEFIMMVTSFPANFLVLVFGVLGAFMFSSEYASGMILSTLTAVPRRGLVLAAKAVVLTLISAIVAALIVAAGVVISVMLVPEVAADILTTQVISSLIGTIVYLVAVALLAFAIAGLLRSTAGAITVVVGIVFLAPAVFEILTQVTDWTWVATMMDFLPTALGSTLGSGILPDETARLGGIGYWPAMAALAAWVMVPMAAAAKLFFSRDAK